MRQFWTLARLRQSSKCPCERQPKGCRARGSRNGSIGVLRTKSNTTSRPRPRHTPQQTAQPCWGPYTRAGDVGHHARTSDNVGDHVPLRVPNWYPYAVTILLAAPLITGGILIVALAIIVRPQAPARRMPLWGFATVFGTYLSMALGHRPFQLPGHEPGRSVCTNNQRRLQLGYNPHYWRAYRLNWCPVDAATPQNNIPTKGDFNSPVS